VASMRSHHHIQAYPFVENAPGVGKAKPQMTPFYITVLMCIRLLVLCRPNIWPEKHLPQLKPVFQALGQLIALVGEQVAGLCDQYMRQQVLSTTAYPTMFMALPRSK
jgi:hypothetical protein